MRKFDVKAVDNKATQYWSSLRTTTRDVVGQVPNSGVSDIKYAHTEEYHDQFEYNLDNWNVIYPDRIVMDDNSTATGFGYSVGLLPFNPGASQAYAAAEREVKVTPGARYRFEVAGRATSDFDGGTNSKLRISAARTGNLISAAQYDAKYLNPDTWTYKATESTLPADVDSVKIQLYADHSAGTVYVDDVRVIRVDAGGLDPILDNRNITSDSPAAIAIDRREGVVTAPEFTNFSLSMVIQPEAADLWLIKLGDDLGVKVGLDSSLTLHWTIEGEPAQEKILFDQQVSYFALSRTGSEITMQLNTESRTINGDDYSFTGFTMGGGTGSLLVDRIAFSVGGNLPKAGEYFDLFRLQRLDNVPRPNGQAGFTYIDDIAQPVIIDLDKTKFLKDGDYYYSAAQNATDPGIWHIERRSTFDIEYSVNRGESWEPLPQSINLNEKHREVMFRHMNDDDVSYNVIARITPPFTIPTPFFETAITGSVHLPEDSGVGYYDAEEADFTSAQIRVQRLTETDDAGITTVVGNPIRSVEFLGTVADIQNFMRDNYSEQIRIKNGDFESNFDKWDVSGSSIPTIVTTEKRSGTRSVKFVNAGQLVKDNTDEWHDVSLGEKWRLSGWFKNESFTGPGGLRLQRRIASTGTWQDLGVTNVPEIGIGWTLSSTTPTIPADTDKIKARVAFSGTGTIYLDDMTLTRITDSSLNRTDNRLFDIYINGTKRELSTLKPGQIYHVVFVFDVPIDFVDLNPSGLVGIGASSVAYTQSDAFYVFNTFAGNTFVSGMETISSLTDGISPNSDPNAPYSAMELQWNS